MVKTSDGVADCLLMTIKTGSTVNTFSYAVKQQKQQSQLHSK